MFRRLSSNSKEVSIESESETSEPAIGTDTPGDPPRRGSSRSLLSFGHLRDYGRRRGGSLTDSTLDVNTRDRVDDRPLSDPLGITLVHEAPNTLVDYIFVHGLGGASRKTWSWNRDIQYFWPSWLPSDKDFSQVRIFTFGYNADFRGPDTTSNIIDFAKDLLFGMLTYSGDEHHSVPIGSYPIIFIVHSLGGLVLKKAFIIGRADEQYSSIIAQIYGIIFLATPHRGSDFARTLNYVLSLSPRGTSSKLYISELERNSSSLQDINEQFRTLYGNVALVSFYESFKTQLAPGVKKIIVDKDSAVLGLPQETSSQLAADHHTICKFRSTNESNYISVTSVLKLFLSRILKKESSKTRTSSSIHVKKLERILAIHEDFDVDLTLPRKRPMPGSCQWILSRNSFTSWLDGTDTGSNILWLSGPPAVGKSVLAGFIVDHIRQRLDCQHYFFVSNDQQKKTAAYFLRAMAFQVAQSNEDFRENLIDLHEASEITFGEQTANVIWLKIFEGILFKMNIAFPLYWVVDALDEADSPSLLASLFTKIEEAFPVRLLIISRMTQDILIPFHVHAGSIRIFEDTISTEDTLNDIQAYVKHAVGTLPGDKTFQLEIADQVLKKASGSFLWVTLALDSIQKNWHTAEDIRQAMTELPAGMEALYVRMAQKFAAQAPRLVDMAQKILMWTACAMRPLDIIELEQALSPEFGNFVSLEDTIMQICGQFVSVEKSKVSLIHHTAVQFLLHESERHSSPITTKGGHTYLAIACINFLSDIKWRQILASLSGDKLPLQSVGRSSVLDDYHFLSYAISSWAYHISLAKVDSDQLQSLLVLFFDKYSLSWINAVALLGDLRTLIRAAQYLKTYIKRRKNKTPQTPHQSLQADGTDILRQWSVDLIRLVGKFGSNLARSPSSIYRLIPPFCPKDSMLSRTVSQLSGNAFSVAGISSTTWDDCVARLNVGGDQTASKILCTEQYFIVLIASNGTLVVYHAETCEEKRRLRHGEYVTFMTVDKNHTRIATAGVHTIRVWDLANGKLLYSLPKDDQARIVGLSLKSEDSTILLGLDDCQVRCIGLSTQEEIWGILAKEVGEKDHSCPRVMAFSPDNGRVAIAYRGKPVVVWDLTTPLQLPRKCIRTEDRYKSESDVWNAPEVIRWLSEGSHILVLYQDTVIVDWDLVEDEQVEHHHVGAREMACSPDSNFLLTSDHTGTVKIWTLPHFNLIYQLSHSEFVRDLAFSPDTKRFYDVRGSLCNVWEPDALFRPVDVGRDDQSSNCEAAASSDPVISGDKNDRSQITALVCDVEDKFYCCGKDDGTIAIHEMKRGKKLRKLYAHSATVSIVAMAWSQSSKFIASADDCGRIVVKRLEKPTRQAAAKWSVYPMLDFRVQEGVQQLLFSVTEKFLLVSLPLSDVIWDLPAKEEACRYRHEQKSGRKWINHPLDRSLLLWVDPMKIKLHQWQDLKKLTVGADFTISDFDLNIFPPPDDREAFSASLGFSNSGPMSPSEPAEVVSSIACTKDKNVIVIEIRSNTGHKSARFVKRRIELVLASDLDPPAKSNRLRHDINSLAPYMERLIGSFQDQAVFLDHQYWLCTWAVDLPVSSYKKHFFLPSDWLNIDTLDLTLLNDHGTLLCPRNGEVAIVRSGIRI